MEFYLLLNKGEVKMAGYLPSSFFYFYGPLLDLSPYKRKKGTRPISSHLDRTSLVNKRINQNYNKILECDWLSGALIIAFIGQFTRHAWCYWTVYASFARAVI